MEEKNVYTVLFSVLAVSQLFWFLISFFVRHFFVRISEDIKTLFDKMDKLQCNETAQRIAKLEERISKK